MKASFLEVAEERAISMQSLQPRMNAQANVPAASAIQPPIIGDSIEPIRFLRMVMLFVRRSRCRVSR